MSYAKIFVEHYDKTGVNSWSSDYTLIDAYDVQTKTAMGDKKNTFSFKVLNVDNNYSTFFDISDKVNIYIVKNGDTYDSDDLIMSGVIKNISRDLNSDVEQISISGVDYSEVLMGAISFVDVEGKNAVQVMQDAINKTNSLNSAGAADKKFNIGWNSDNPTKKYNSATGLYDGDDFKPLYGERHFYKSLKSIIERMMGPKYLDDGRYYWYINTDNEFVLRKRLDEVSLVGGQELSLTEGQDFYSLKIAVDNSEVKNWIIWKAGFDPRGYSIQSFVQDPVSITRHGIKPFVLIDTDFVSALYSKEDTTETLGDKDKFPASYPYTSGFLSSITDRENDPNVVAGNNVTVDNDTEWNYAVRREATYKVKGKAEEYLAYFTKGYLQITCDMDLNTTYQVGQLIKLNAPRFGYTEKLLRIHEVNHDIKSTRIVAQEDEATI